MVMKAVLFCNENFDLILSEMGASRIDARDRKKLAEVARHQPKPIYYFIPEYIGKDGESIGTWTLIDEVQLKKNFTYNETRIKTAFAVLTRK